MYLSLKTFNTKYIARFVKTKHQPFVHQLEDEALTGGSSSQALTDGELRRRPRPKLEPDSGHGSHCPESWVSGTSAENSNPELGGSPGEPR